MDTYYKTKEEKGVTPVLNVIQNVKLVQLMKTNVPRVLLDINLKDGNVIKFLKLL